MFLEKNNATPTFYKVDISRLYGENENCGWMESLPFTRTLIKTSN